MFESLCTYPLRSDLFAFAVHPTAPVLALGLASGHVQLNCIPTSPSPLPAGTSPTFSPSSPPSTSYPIVNTITTQWTTRRHKPSCRTLSFTPDGLRLVSAGTDGIVKLADTPTGRVCSKIALSPSSRKSSSTNDQPTLIHILNQHTLLLATDSSAIHVYDIRTSSASSSLKHSGPSITSKPSQTHHPHLDYVTSVTSLPSSGSDSKRDSTQFLSTGGTTVAITDLRRGVLVQSEDQREELLASALCGDKVVVGGEKGRIRAWQVGVWDDNEVEVDVFPQRTVGIESIVVVPKDEGEDKESKIVIGMENGLVSFVEVGGGRNGRGAKVLEGEVVQHDELEGVVGVGFVNGRERMVTGGGTVVKVWDEGLKLEEDDDGDEEEDEEEEEDEAGAMTSNRKRGKANVNENGSGENADGSGNNSNSDDEDSRRPRKKKRRKGRNKGAATNGILRFKGLD